MQLPTARANVVCLQFVREPTLNPAWRRCLGVEIAEPTHAVQPLPHRKFICGSVHGGTAIQRCSEEGSNRASAWYSIGYRTATPRGNETQTCRCAFQWSYAC
jgi:hypothetical protein